ncbi:MAG: thiamine pyrophosphate-binding protein [Alphaproteobacteria bacterium]|nr:thiamine pyrophosphate-binding protein [Alphaproteobacteria bacterium]
MSQSGLEFVPPRPLSARRMIEALRNAAVSHVVVVPDTYQKSFLSAVDQANDLAVVAACTEDEALGVNAGLYVTGHRPILSIQNNGIFACLNTLRGIALDGAVPTVMLIGLYGYKPDRPPEESALRMVRMLEPTLTTWGVPTRRLTSDEDLAAFPQVYEEALSRRGPSALVVPIPTAA